MPPDSSKRILVVDDVPEFLRSISKILRSHFDVAICSSPLRAVRLMKKGEFDLLLTTLIMSKLDGFEIIRRVRGGGSTTPIIMITSHGDDSTSVEATRLGASDYLTEPVAPEELIARIRRVLASNTEEPARTKKTSLVTRNPAMRDLCNLTSRAARSSCRVLILGETGTGKQLFARRLHEESSFQKGPFVEVNCAAIPSELLESEFFGHERGAFTGAISKRRGRFEEATGGTLFLDEIGELTMGLQSKLLRVLQSGDFTKVGGTQTLHSNARIIAATNRDLEEESRLGRFRSDLFYRLNVVLLKVPPLRDRKEDIPLLLNHFARKFAISPRESVQFSSEVLQILVGYSWPGNIRELEHLVEQLCVLHPGQSIDPKLLPPRILKHATVPSSQRSDLSHLPYRQALSEFQRNYLENAITEAHGNLAEAARIAGMDRSHFFRKAKSFELF